ncbi:MAG: MFS transporter [Coriobacteriia bacterium]|nr:MFS transporter [Coriobacteriia bacterium]
MEEVFPARQTRSLRLTVPGYAWVLLAVVFLAGVTAPANMSKVMVLAPVLMQEFGIGVSQVGYLIAGFYLLGFVLAFPAAAIANRWGVKVTILAAVGVGVVGSLLGALSTGLGLLLVSRVLEGAGFAMMGVAGPSAISPWFPKERRGTALGIWGAWAATAMVICPTLWAWIYSVAAWRTVWWATFAFDLLVFILVMLFVKQPDFYYEGEEEAHLEQKTKISDVFKVRSVVLLGLIFLFGELAFMSMNGFLVTYLNTQVGLPLSLASLMMSVCALVGVIGSVLAGMISDKLKTRKWVLMFAIVTGIVFSAAIFSTHNVTALWIWIIIGGVAGAGVPAVLWAAVPGLVRPSQVANAVAVNAFSQNVGMFIGATAIGTVIASLGWSAAGYFILAPCYVICAILLLFTGKQLR